MATGSSTAQGASDSETLVLSEDDHVRVGPSHEPIPARIGRYTVIDRVGRGGMGSVYRAYDAKLRREVALKQVRADRLGPETESRLVQEAQAMARLSHANVVAVYDVDVGETLTLAMEYVPGRSVAGWLDEAHPWREVLEVFIGAGRGLAAAHAVGLVHRDFKPANVLLGDDGIAKVTDFGLAKLDDSTVTAGGAAEEPSWVEEPDASVPLTRADTVMGTPKYMAPEQHSGARADARCDQYAFCVSLWEALTGRAPFSAETYAELAQAKLAGPPAWPRELPVPQGLVRAIARGLKPDPAARHDSMAALLGVLEDSVSGRRRRWSLGLAAVGGVGLVLGAGVWQAQASEPCSGADAQLVGVWDDEARERVREGLLAHDVAYAADTWSRVAAGLDAHTSAWKEQHHEACAATTIRGEQSPAVMDLRMQCLQRVHGELSERVALLATADEGVLRRAIGMVDALTEPGTCGDIERLTALSPPPADPAEAARVEEARAELARARLLGVAGKRKEALEVVEAAYERFSDVEHPPARAELEFQLGNRLETMARYEESEAALRRALAVALEHDVREVAVPAARELARVVGYYRAKPAPGLEYGEVARSLARRLDAKGLAEADVLDAMGVIRFADADYAGAAKLHREALALKEAVLGPDHHGLTALLVNLGMAVEVLGDYEEAAAHQERAIALALEHFGPDHPRLASYTLNLGNVRFAQARYDDAEALYQRALTIVKATYGPRHVAVATITHNLGLLDQQRGNYERAEARVREAMQTRIEIHGPEHPEVADSWMMLGVIAEQAGRAEEALEPVSKALAIREKIHGPRSHHVGKLRMNLGMVYGDLQRYDEAEAQMQEGLSIKRETLGEDHLEVGEAWINLASVSRSRGDLDQAAERWEAALEILRPALGEEHLKVAHAENGLGKTLLDQGEPERARELLEHVLALRANDDVAPCTRADTEFALAKALWPSTKQRALELARAAEKRCTTPGKQDEVAEIRAWVAARSG